MTIDAEAIARAAAKRALTEWTRNIRLNAAGKQAMADLIERIATEARTAVIAPEVVAAAQRRAAEPLPPRTGTFRH